MNAPLPDHVRHALETVTLTTSTRWRKAAPS